MRFITIITIFLITGCATMLDNGSEPVQVIGSDNAEARVEITLPDGQPYQTRTPTFITAKPSSFYPLHIRVVDPCYQKIDTNVPKSVASTYWLNLLNGHGLYIDYFTGHMWNYDERVVLPLIKAEDKNDTCGEIWARNAGLDSVVTSREIVRKNRMGMGLLYRDTASHNHNGDANDIGLYAEVSHSLSETTWLNLRGFFHAQSEWRDERCGSYYCSANIDSNQKVLALSVRQYLTPNTNFYAGLGSALVSYTQSFDNYGGLNSGESKSDRGYTPAMFVDLGWMKRIGRVSITVGGMIDFADLHLTSPSTDKGLSENDKFADARDRDLLRRMLYTSKRMTHYSVGLTMPF